MIFNRRLLYTKVLLKTKLMLKMSKLELSQLKMLPRFTKSLNSKRMRKIKSTWLSRLWRHRRKVMFTQLKILMHTKLTPSRMSTLPKSQLLSKSTLLIKRPQLLQAILMRRRSTIIMITIMDMDTNTLMIIITIIKIITIITVRTMKNQSKLFTKNQNLKLLIQVLLTRQRVMR